MVVVDVTDRDSEARATAHFDELRTERLRLRRWRESDRAPFAAMNADPRVRRFFPDLLDRAASDASIDRFEQQFVITRVGLWAVELVETGEFVGFTGLQPMPDGVPGTGSWEIGWRLAAHAWHQGFATEAARAVLGLAFRRLGLPEVWSMTALLNEPSIAVMRRIGLREHARADHPRLPPGDPLRPHAFYRITAGEYSALRVRQNLPDPPP